MDYSPPYLLIQRHLKRADLNNIQHSIIKRRFGRLLPALFFILFFSVQSKVSCQVIAPDSSVARSDSLKRIARPGPFVVNHDTLHSLAAYDTARADTVVKTQKKYKHSPLKAALFSAVLPGLGQAYNKKYWKIPIVYVGFGGLGYALYYTETSFQGFRTAYRQQEALIPNPYASYMGISDAADLKVYRDYYKKYLDISSIGIAVWYMLTIIDAVVDAHLMDWNMKDDLSVSWHPFFAPAPDCTSVALGITVGLGF
jgi:hypothetical protein